MMVSSGVSPSHVDGVSSAAGEESYFTLRAGPIITDMS